MTVIAGVITDIGYAIGGDSGAFAGNLKMTSANPKVFKIGSYLLGVAGSFRVINEIAKLQSGNPDTVKDAIHRNLGNDAGEWSVLFVSPSGIQELAEDFSLVTYTENYAAIGAGMEIATGALASLIAYEDNARDIVKSALYITEIHSTFCAGPHRVLSATI